MEKIFPHPTCSICTSTKPLGDEGFLKSELIGEEMKKWLAIVLIAGVSAGCTHTQVLVKDAADDKLTCTEVATQTAEVKSILRSIDDKTGFSGRNVAMGIFFWPGVVVNQLNAADARKAANSRLGVLADLAKEKKCP